MYEGARQLPTMHVSVRVPWHDAQWNGTICSKPCDNTSCLVLTQIARKRNDELEEKFSGRRWDENEVPLPACAIERGAFMADFDYEIPHNHPYNRPWEKNGRYKHIVDTHLRYEAYSATGVPYAWMKKHEKTYDCEKAKIYNIDYRPDFEPENLGQSWVQDYHNQLSMLDTFFGAVKPEESLVFFYAKNTPLTDNPRRVIVGIGRVLNVGNSVEYNYSETRPSDSVKCVLWERNIHHSIRNNMKDGFLLPYHELLELAESGANIDLPSLVLHAPDEYREAFSMGAEHVTHDQAITVLLSCSSILNRIEKHVGNKWSEAHRWIDNQLNRIWQLRGAFPGLGSALTAFGVEYGTLVAHEVDRLLYADDSKEIRDPWPMVEKILKNPDILPDYLRGTIGSSTLQLWNGLNEESKNLLKLLARFDISSEQADRWFDSGKRKKIGIDVSDEEIIKNPYLIYEADREQYEPISVGAIDRGLFLYNNLANIPPIPKPSHCNEAIDKRRGRALIINLLDQVAIQGHTLFPQSWLVDEICNLDISPKCKIGENWMNTFSEFLEEKIANVQTIDEPAWQLERYKESRKIISSAIKKRLKGKRHLGEYQWRKFIDDQLQPMEEIKDKEIEKCAREEKAKALEEIYRSRFSVLIGPAGTGKTSLLKALLNLPSVAKGGVLLLAPTGKARVQMQKQAKKVKAFTLAQFLLKRKRYHPKTNVYKVTNNSETQESGYKTVVIDECSMLTEEQLAAVLDAIKTDRLILMGDPRQLPPIGAGRPFVDIVQYVSELRPNSEDVKKLGYAELKTVRRQSVDIKNYDEVVSRDDVLLSQWFTDEAPDPSADESWNRLVNGKSVGIKAIEWKTDSDLQEKLLFEINLTTRKIANEVASAESLEFDDKDEISCFEISLGGRPRGDVVYFHLPKSEKHSGQIDVESWQILSPVYAGEKGVDGLNRWIQHHFRLRAKERWLSKQKICKPLGVQQIICGDKVINLINKRRSNIYPKEGGDKYVANGEIGLAVGQYKSAKSKIKKPWQLQVEFSTQPNFRYAYDEQDFGEESTATLELAYALTIHRAQGSEFGKTFVILPNPCGLLSRELLYTALTRQQKEVVVFHQGNIQELMKYTKNYYSDTKQRLTNLFADPNPIKYGERFLEEGLVYRTTKGEIVRSKSEKIIADLLHRLNISYYYEESFIGKDGSTRYPDFTIEDDESGQRIILEHLGMLSEPLYQDRWQRKLEWYRSQGVIPQDEGEGEVAILMTTTEEDIKDTSKIEKELKDILGL